MTNHSTLVSDKQVRNNEKAFGAVPANQFIWLSQQKPCVVQLWAESWKADLSGNGWVAISSSLKRTAFYEAKKTIESACLFEYKKVWVINKNKKHIAWFVKNVFGGGLHAHKILKLSKSHKLKTSHNKRYLKFLKSDYWQEVRQLVLARDNHTCQQCKATERLQVHHISYKNHGDEKNHLEDLITLCSTCHSALHGC